MRIINWAWYSVRRQAVGLCCTISNSNLEGCFQRLITSAEKKIQICSSAMDDPVCQFFTWKDVLKNRGSFCF